MHATSLKATFPTSSFSVASHNVKLRIRNGYDIRLPHRQFYRIQPRPKHVKRLVNKSRVAISNDDVICGLSRPLVPETISRPILKNQKSLKNWKTGGDRQEIYELKATISTRPIKWYNYFHLAVLLIGDFRSRCVFTPWKRANNSKNGLFFSVFPLVFLQKLQNYFKRNLISSTSV